METLSKSWIDRAQFRAKAYGERAAVVIVDCDGGGRKLRIVRESYLDSCDFSAFDGKILAIVDADGWQW